MGAVRIPVSSKPCQDVLTSSLERGRGLSVVLCRDGDLGKPLTSDLKGADLETLARRIADQRR